MGASVSIIAGASPSAQVPSTLVDVHCHILPSLDDGALDVQDSLAMARQAAADGIAVVCATPHIRDDHDVRIDELPSRLSSLTAELAAAAIPVHLVTGAEVAQRAAEQLQISTLKRLTLGAGGWLLLEPSPGPLNDDLSALVDRLSDHQLKVVIAHPERHSDQDFESRLTALTHLGCLIQWTAEFVLEGEGDSGEGKGDSVEGERDSVAIEYAKKGLLHLLGSDSHSSHGGRPLKLRAAVERLRGCCPPHHVAWIAHQAPWAVVRGQPTSPPW